MSQKIELAKVRDFGEVITDTFIFLKQNFKPLFKYIIMFCGIFLVAAIATGAIFVFKAAGNTDYQNANTFDNSMFVGIFTTIALVLVLALLCYISFITTIYSYIALYKAKGNIAPTNEEMWGYVKYYFMRVLGASILVFLITAVGLVFCVLPGIYLNITLSFVAPIMIFENTSFSYAFNRSFSLIRDNWWITFGIILVMGIIVGVGGMIFSIPLFVVQLLIALMHLTANKTLLYGGFGGAVIFSQLKYVLYIIPQITVALCYFNLVESKEAIGLLGRIDQLGTDAPAADDTHEQTEEY